MQRLPIRTRCSSALRSELIANSKVPQMFPTSSCRSRLKTNNYQLAPILYGPRKSTKAILREYIGGCVAGIFHHGNDYRGERYRVRTDTPTHEALSAISRAPDSRLRETVWRDRKSTRLNSSHMSISYAVFCLKKNRQDIIFIYSRGCFILYLASSCLDLRH